MHPDENIELQRAAMEHERNLAFEKLRLQTHAEMEPRIAQRIAQDPHPTEEEVMVGAFREMIEPQVRDAVFEMHRKGYASASSGFGGEHGEEQALDGFFPIDDATKAALEQAGATVRRGSDIGDLGDGPGDYASISFLPDAPDIEDIRSTWKRLTDILPERGAQADPSISGAGVDFRQRYAPERTDVERAALEKSLAAYEFHPDYERKMRERLAELSGADGESPFAEQLLPAGFDARNTDLWKLKNDPSKLVRESKPHDDKTLDQLEASIRAGEEQFARMRDLYGVNVVSMETKRAKNASGGESVFTTVDFVDGENLSETKNLPPEAKDELETLYLSLGQYYRDAWKQKLPYWGDARSDQFVYGAKSGEDAKHFYLTDVDPEFYREGEDEWHTFEAMLGSVSHDLVENERKFDGGVRFQKARERLLTVIDEMLKERPEQPMLVEAKGWLES